MKRVFLDSGAFFAVLVAQDASPAAATEAFQRAQSEGWVLTTTNAVVIETYALLLSRTRAGRSAAIAFLDALEQSSVHVERIPRSDEKQAVILLPSGSCAMPVTMPN